MGLETIDVQFMPKTRYQRLEELDLLPRVCGVRNCDGFASYFVAIESDKLGTRWQARCVVCAQKHTKELMKR